MVDQCSECGYMFVYYIRILLQVPAVKLSKLMKELHHV